jgi:hypothetical protein
MEAKIQKALGAASDTAIIAEVDSLDICLWSSFMDRMLNHRSDNSI